VILINGDDTPALRNRVLQISDAWKKQFDQQSVGIMTATQCAVF
jgi:hypothetical protein